MKIAILTQPLGHNYGCILQNWALQRTLVRLGHEPVTINMRLLQDWKKGKFALNTKRLLIYVVSLSKRNEFRADPGLFDSRYEKMHRFVSEHITVTKIVHPPLTADSDVLHGVEAVVVGSDQVWRPDYSPNLLNYFCDFDRYEQKYRKVAYAASFGTSNPDFNISELSACVKLASKFTAVSVREDSAVRLCKKNFNLSAEHVLDPVMLLSSQDYQVLLREEPDGGSGGEHCACYVLDTSLVKKRVADVAADRLGLRIKQLKPSPRAAKLSRLFLPPLQYDSPSAWLYNLKRSKFVVTDSFHGLCFSIIFKRPFIVIANPSRGIDRFESLLSILGLEERMIVEDVNFIDIERIIAKSINWAAVESKLSEFRATSLAYLSNSLMDN